MLYIACAKLPDGTLDEREAERILHLTRAHSKGLAEGYAEQAVEDVAHALGQATEPQDQLKLVVDAAHRVAKNLDDEAKADLVAELRSIARSDGRTTSAELDFVHAVAKTLGVD